MDEDEDRSPGVPGPRQGGHEFPGHPVVPAPRAAPALECLLRPDRTVATTTGRRPPAADGHAGSAALVLAPHRSTAVAVRDESVGARLRAVGRELARAVVRLVGAAVRGVRSLLEGLVPCPSVR
jgi:hypothetical protein